MSVHILLSTSLRRFAPGYDPAEGMRLDMAEAMSVEDVALRIGIPPGEIAIIMINGIHASLAQKVFDGDRVALFPAVGGG